MDSAAWTQVVEELGAAFGGAQDVSPDGSQPLHVLLPHLTLQAPWSSPTRALLRFTSWPSVRPDFWVDLSVVNASGAAPRSDRTDLVLGEPWRGFSFNMPWTGTETPTEAVQKWLVRFREDT
jgi:hypothetical protein